MAKWLDTETGLYYVNEEAGTLILNCERIDVMIYQHGYKKLVLPTDEFYKRMQYEEE